MDDKIWTVRVFACSSACPLDLARPASLAVRASAPVSTWRRGGSGSDSGAQALDATAERGVLDRGDEDRRVEDALLEQVADTLGLLFEQSQRVAGLDMLHRSQDADIGVLGAESLGGVSTTSSATTTRTGSPPAAWCLRVRACPRARRHDRRDAAGRACVVFPRPPP